MYNTYQLTNLFYDPTELFLKIKFRWSLITLKSFENAAFLVHFKIQIGKWKSFIGFLNLNTVCKDIRFNITQLLKIIWLAIIWKLGAILVDFVCQRNGLILRNMQNTGRWKYSVFFCRRFICFGLVSIFYKFFLCLWVKDIELKWFLFARSSTIWLRCYLKDHIDSIFSTPIINPFILDTLTLNHTHTQV